MQNVHGSQKALTLFDLYLALLPSDATPLPSSLQENDVRCCFFFMPLFGIDQSLL